jgi:hypothetical protein
MNKGMNMTILPQLEKLSDILRGDVGSDYALGWMQSMINDLMHNQDIKLSKKQRIALETIVTENIDWAQKCATKHYSER